MPDWISELALMKDDRSSCGTRHDLYSKHERSITTALCAAAVAHWSCSEGNAWRLLGVMEIIKWLIDRVCPRSKQATSTNSNSWLTLLVTEKREQNSSTDIRFSQFNSCSTHSCFCQFVPEGLLNKGLCCVTFCREGQIVSLCWCTRSIYWQQDFKHLIPWHVKKNQLCVRLKP